MAMAKYGRDDLTTKARRNEALNTTKWSSGSELATESTELRHRVHRGIQGVKFSKARLRELGSGPH